LRQRKRPQLKRLRLTSDRLPTKRVLLAHFQLRRLNDSLKDGQRHGSLEHMALSRLWPRFFCHASSSATSGQALMQVLDLFTTSIHHCPVQGLQTATVFSNGVLRGQACSIKPYLVHERRHDMPENTTSSGYPASPTAPISAPSWSFTSITRSGKVRGAAECITCSRGVLGYTGRDAKADCGALRPQHR